MRFVRHERTNIRVLPVVGASIGRLPVRLNTNA